MHETSCPSGCSSSHLDSDSSDSSKRTAAVPSDAAGSKTSGRDSWADERADAQEAFDVEAWCAKLHTQPLLRDKECTQVVARALVREGLVLSRVAGHIKVSDAFLTKLEELAESAVKEAEYAHEWNLCTRLTFMCAIETALVGEAGDAPAAKKARTSAASEPETAAAQTCTVKEEEMRWLFLRKAINWREGLTSHECGGFDATTAANALQLGDGSAQWQHVAHEAIERVIAGAQAAFQKMGIPGYWNSWEARKAVQQSYKTHHRQAVGSSTVSKRTHPATLAAREAALAAKAAAAVPPAEGVASNGPSGDGDQPVITQPASPPASPTASISTAAAAAATVRAAPSMTGPSP